VRPDTIHDLVLGITCVQKRRVTQSCAWAVKQSMMQTNYAMESANLAIPDEIFGSRVLVAESASLLYSGAFETSTILNDDPTAT
jgi:hypothetical protein